MSAGSLGRAQTGPEDQSISPSKSAGASSRPIYGETNALG